MENKKYIKEDKSKLLHYAMRFGYVLGGFWIFKYLFVILSAKFSALAFVNVTLSIGTPLLLFYFLMKYKESLALGKMSYWHGIQFTIMLFFFASILEAAIIIVHIIWIDPEYVARAFNQTITMMETLGLNDDLIEKVKEQTSFSPFAYVFNAAMSNIFLGLLLALPIVPIIQRVQPQKNEQNSQIEL